MKDKMQMSVGVRFCSNCENNLRCEECVYPKEYKELLAKHDCVLDEVQRAKSEIDRWRSREKAITEQFNELGQNYEALYTENVRQKEEIERLKSPCEMQIEVSKKLETSIKAEAVKEFAEVIKKNHGALFNTIFSKRFGEIIDNLVNEYVTKLQ